VQAQQGAGVLGLERRGAGQALEPDGAQGVQVGAAVDREFEHAGLLRHGGNGGRITWCGRHGGP